MLLFLWEAARKQGHACGSSANPLPRPFSLYLPPPCACCCHGSALCFPVTARKTSLPPLQGCSPASQTPRLSSSQRTFKKQLINLITSFLCCPERRGIQGKKKKKRILLREASQVDMWIPRQLVDKFFPRDRRHLLQRWNWLQCEADPGGKMGTPCLSSAPPPLLVTPSLFSQSFPSNVSGQGSCTKDLKRTRHEHRQVQPLRMTISAPRRGPTATQQPMPWINVCVDADVFRRQAACSPSNLPV